MINMTALLSAMMKKNASDLHMRVGTAPVFRVNGELFRISAPPLGKDDFDQIISEVFTPNQQDTFLRNREIDVGYGLKGVGRFRINGYFQRGSPSLAIRAIRTEIPSFEELNLPEIILDIAMRKRGLILVTGTTGSGKSTLLASMIEHINASTSMNIVTVEDPIEFLYRDNKSIIVQREVGADTKDFATALRSCFRQDPDIILIGEIRDKETMEIALAAADTGHLVVSTLHTMNASETITRITAFFPPHQQEQIRLVLSSVLVSVISLRLLPRKDGGGVVPAAEILVNNSAIQEYILDPTGIRMIPGAIADGHVNYGSQTFDQSLLQLYHDELITMQTALQYASNPEDFELKVKGIEGTSDRGWG